MIYITTPIHNPPPRLTSSPKFIEKVKTWSNIKLSSYCLKEDKKRSVFPQNIECLFEDIF